MALSRIAWIVLILEKIMYDMWLREAGYWLPCVDAGYHKSFLYREMNVYLKRALTCFMEEECI